MRSPLIRHRLPCCCEKARLANSRKIVAFQGTMHHLRRLIQTIPPTLRPPLAAGLIVFFVAISTTQLALRASGQEANAQIETLARVYLAGIADAVVPTLQNGDLPGFESRFASAVADHEGIVERVLFAFDSSGTLIATAGDKSIPAETARTIKIEGFRIDEGAGIAWVSRRVVSPGPYVLVSGLDVFPIIAQREQLTLSIIGIDLMLATICGLLAYLTLRRMNRPLTDVVDRLSAAASGTLTPVDTGDLASPDPRVAAIYRSFNSMIDSVRERERLRSELAEQEQSAALGRMAATIAHEVRNPLGGMATAVSTIKRFGDNAEVRTESIGFLERGIDTLDQIVTSTLNLYRPADERRLTKSDFADLERLIRPAVDREALQLEWNVDLPDTLSITAVGARQVLLNLLLNACAVTPAGGKVGLAARIEGGALVCEISDGGAGMPADRAQHLSGAAAAAGRSKRIGIDVIVSLLETLDGEASVRTEPGQGSTVVISIPLEPANV